MTALELWKELLMRMVYEFGVVCLVGGFVIGYSVARLVDWWRKR